MEIINLIKKDILVCKKYYVFSIIYIIIFAGLFSEYGMISFIMCVIGIHYVINNTSMAYDDKYKADIMMNILPVSRKDIVLARYLNVLISMMYVLALYYLAVLITSFKPIFGVQIMPIDFVTFFIGLLAICLFNGIETPLYYKLGYQKTKFFGFVVYFGFFAASSYLVGNFSAIEKAMEFLNKSSDLIRGTLLFLISILVSYISYLISSNIYRKKDF